MRAESQELSSIPAGPSSLSRLSWLACVATLALSLMTSRPVQAVQIERFELQGSQFISLEAFLALTDLEVGDAYDPDVIQSEFWKIWDTGLFEDVRIEHAVGAGGGEVVIFIVREKPRVDSVTYEKVKGLKQDQLMEVLHGEGAVISVSSTLNEDRIALNRQIIEALLAGSGHPHAHVSVVQRPVGTARVALDFRIDAGPKVKISDIRFAGNSVFSDRQLKKLLESTGEASWMHFLSKKSVFFQPRLEKDLAAILDAYKAKGYLDAQIGTAVVRDSRPGKSGKEETSFISLEIPIQEGDPYRLGAVTVSGAVRFSNEELRGLIPLAQGELANDALLRLGLSRIDNRYGDEGYLYESSTHVYSTDPGSHVASVHITIQEGQLYTVRSIEFDGNVRTRDDVLRRELRLQEGEQFSRRDFLLGLRKISQLGYFRMSGEPSIQPADTGKPEVDIIIRGEEVGRNEVQFGGGFSGVDGFFGTFSFSSRNFMGRGASLSLSAQLGGATTNYSVSYVEPYILGTRGSLGGQIFARERDFDGFDQQSSGLSVFWSHPLSTYSSMRLTGRFETSKVQDDTAGIDEDEFTTFSITPSYRLDTRDNPFRPTRGRLIRGLLEIGWSEDKDPDVVSFDPGVVNYFKPRLEFTQRWRTFKDHHLAMHVEGGLLVPVSGDDKDPVPGDGIDTPYLPVFERHFLGGDQSIRGVEIRSVGPRLHQYRQVLRADGLPETDDKLCATPFFFDPGDGVEQCFNQVEDRAIGGNAFFVANIEYVVPVSDVFEVAAFFDVGNSFGVDYLDVLDLVNPLDEDVLDIIDSDPFDLKATAGVELRFHTPVLQQPLRLIYGCKVFGDYFDDEGTCDFQFSIGRTFQ